MLAPAEYDQATDKVASRNAEVCIYARTSGEGQRFNFSIPEQVNKCWEYCEKRGWSVRRVFVDECQPGKNIERRNLQQMLGRAEAGEFSAIVFWKLDRVARSLFDLVGMEKTLRQRDVGLCSTTEYLDTTTPVGRFNFRSLASVAELEREIIGERARLGLYGLARQGKWPNHNPPLGYVIDGDKRLVVDKAEAGLVLKIFQRYIEEKSMPQVAFELNSENINTRNGGKWTARAVRDIISNRIYIGEYSVAGIDKHVDDYRIVSDSSFEEVKKVMGRYGQGANRPLMPADRKLQEIETVLRDYEKFLHGHPEPHPESSVSWCKHESRVKWDDSRSSCKDCSLVLPKEGMDTLNQEVRRVDNGKPVSKDLTGRDWVSAERWIEVSKASDQTQDNFASALAEITKIGNALEVPSEVLERSARLLKIVFLKRLAKGRSMTAFCGAVLYAACRQSGSTRLWHEIAHAAGLQEKHLTRTYRILLREPEITVPTPETCDYARRILELMRVDQPEILQLTTSIAVAAGKRAALNRSPVGVAAAIVYGALEGQRYERSTQREIANVAGVTEATLRNSRKDLAKNRFC